MQNHFGQAELIIQAESQAILLLWSQPLLDSSTPPGPWPMQTILKCGIIWIQAATCVAPPQYLLLNIFSWKSNALRALDCVALVVVGGSMQTATLLENSSFATLTTMSMKSCVFCAAWKLPLLCVSWPLNIFTMSRQDSLSFNSMHCLVFLLLFWEWIWDFVPSVHKLSANIALPCDTMSSQ